MSKDRKIDVVILSMIFGGFLFVLTGGLVLAQYCKPLGIIVVIIGGLSIILGFCLGAAGDSCV